MTVKNIEHLAVFDGDVVMRKDDLTITSDHAEVTFASKEALTENGKPPTGLISPQSQFENSEITLIHATGTVVLQQGEKQIHSKEAYYYQKEDKVILLGEPVAWEKDYRVTGSKMTIFLRENRSIVEGSKMVIHPKDPVQKP
jgi:lipopolysaccharide export system protein LptA